MQLTPEQREELYDIVSSAVCGHFGEWGTSAKVGDEPLRIVLNRCCGPCIDELMGDLTKWLEQRSNESCN